MNDNTFAKNFNFVDSEQFSLKGFREIRRIIGSIARDKFVAVPVTGDNLKNINIVHGDILITKLTTKYIKNKIGVWQTPHGRTAKYAYDNFDGTVTLHNQNGWSQIWQAEDVQLIGIVVRVERDL